MFNWMNTDTSDGRSDGFVRRFLPFIRTKLPVRHSMQQAVPLAPLLISSGNPGNPSESINGPASTETKVVVPEWKIETAKVRIAID